MILKYGLLNDQTWSSEDFALPQWPKAADDFEASLKAILQAVSSLSNEKHISTAPSRSLVYAFSCLLGSLQGNVEEAVDVTGVEEDAAFSIQKAMGLGPKQRTSDAKKIREARLQGDDMAFQGAFTNSGETFDE